jgi:hypothetical protein
MGDCVHIHDVYLGGKQEGNKLDDKYNLNTKACAYNEYCCLYSIKEGATV